MPQIADISRAPVAPGLPETAPPIVRVVTSDVIRTPAENRKHTRHEFTEEKWAAVERIGGGSRHHRIVRADSLSGEIPGGKTG
jgi:hypothetical protein